MTGADKYVAYLEAAVSPKTNPDVKNDYLWSADGNNADHSKDGDPEWDCSGLRHAGLVAAGIADVRTTAEGYRKRAHRIAAPSQIGDFAVLLNADGTAHHIIEYVGAGNTIEAKGAAYGLVRDTVANVTHTRGGVWYRQDSVNAALGNLTPAPAPAKANPAPVVHASPVRHVHNAPHGLHLRAGAGTKYRVLETLPNGHAVTVMRTLHGWSYIKADSTVGWVDSDYLK